ACISLSGPYDFSDCWDGLPELTREAFRVRSHAATQDEAKRNAATLSLKGGVAARITCPIFIMTGKLDRVVPFQESERLAREVKGPCELLIVENGGAVPNNRRYPRAPPAPGLGAEGARGGGSLSPPPPPP